MVSDTFIFYIFYFMFIYPVIEWSIHYFLHVLKEQKHKKHHILFFKNAVRVEKWPIAFIGLGCYLRIYIMIMSFSYYFIIHTCTHKYPKLFPRLTAHHITHHNNKHYNFCVCAIWPDKLFKTYKAIEQ
jgi:hypothetical protein